MTFFSFSNSSLVGLDIQPNSIRLVQLKPRRGGYLAERIAYAPFVSGIFAEGKIKRWDSLLSHLSTLVADANIKGCPAAICLPANLVRMERLTLPRQLSNDEIEAEIHAQMQRDLPGMTDALCIDFSVAPAQNPSYVEVFFAAARREYLTQYRDCVDAAGLHTKIVDVDRYALKRAVHFSLPGKVLPSDTFALISITEDGASFIAFNADDILFNRYGEVDDETSLLHQLKNCMQTYATAFQHLPIRQLLFCGKQPSHAFFTDLAIFLECDIGQPDLLHRIELAAGVDAHLLHSQATDFLVACGAAMRSVPKW